MRRSVILIGLPGAGKSTVGRILAERLQAPFLDLDAEVERQEGVSVEAIFDQRGEAAFRRAERAALIELLSGPPAIISAGGGWAAQPGALAEARNRGAPLIVYLWVSVQTAAARLGAGGGRPLLRPGAMAVLPRLLRERDPSYRQADLTVSTEGRPAAVVAEAVLVGIHRRRSI